jgi:hypothetical protein
MLSSDPPRFIGVSFADPLAKVQVAVARGFYPVMAFEDKHLPAHRYQFVSGAEIFSGIQCPRRRKML